MTDTVTTEPEVTPTDDVVDAPQPMDSGTQALLATAFGIGQHYMMTQTPLPSRLLPPGTTEPRYRFVLQGSVPATEANALLVAGHLADLHPKHPLMGVYEMFTKVRPEGEVSLDNIAAHERSTFIGHVKAWLQWNYTNRKLFEEFITDMMRAHLRRRITQEELFRVELAILTIITSTNDTEIGTEADLVPQEETDAAE